MTTLKQTPAQRAYARKEHALELLERSPSRWVNYSQRDGLGALIHALEQAQHDAINEDGEPDALEYAQEINRFFDTL